MIIGFGKYAGKEVEELPSDYLAWLSENLDQSKFDNVSIIACADKELARRDRDNSHDDYQ